MNKKELPIAVYDSGVGGISVLKELVLLMPNENFIYFGDSANAPYGTKSHDEICRFTLDNIKKLADDGIKAIVIACNTATSVCIEKLREIYKDIPVVGIEPALKPAVENEENSTVLVMATPLTLREKKFEHLLENYDDNAKKIIKLPCPGLMELVEKGITDGKEMEDFLKTCFADIELGEVDSVVLGCTHYPFAKDAIKKFLPNAEFFDGGAGTARQLKRCLEQKELLCDGDEGSVIFQNSLDDEKILKLCVKLLKENLEKVL